MTRGQCSNLLMGYWAHEFMVYVDESRVYNY